MKIVIDSLAGLKNGKVYSPMFGERVLEITLDGKGTFGKYIKNVRNSKTVTQALSASKTQKRFP